MRISLVEFKARIKILKEILTECRLCPRECGVNRLQGELGWCKAGAELEIAYLGPHHGEEPPISGTLGSGTIFLKHCTMQCVYCQNWQISASPPHPPFAFAQGTLSPSPHAERGRGLGSGGKVDVHNINLVSPAQYLPQVLEWLLPVYEEGYELPIVYNTNGYESIRILKLLNGIVDIYLPDIKYADDTLAKKYSHTSDYVENNQKTLREMFRQVGLLQLDEDGIAKRGLIVRHLVLPGLVENSKKCLEFVANLSQQITVSIMSQYFPQYQASKHPEINRVVTPAEYQEVIAYAEKLGLENCYIQEPGSQEVFLPDFTLDKPFK